MFTYKKPFIILFIFISLLLNSCFLILTHSASADESVSVAVPPRPSDFQFELSSSSSRPLQQGENISYQITYGANQSAGTPTTETIVASWNGITAPDNTQLLDYDIGSASDGYGGAVPVIDPVNKTITWTIYDLPAGITDQTLSFNLRAISSYSRSTPFTFSISATMNNQYVSLPIQTLVQTYQYKTSAPSPQPTTQPTAASAAQTQTPTPTPGFTFSNVEIAGLSDSGGTIQTTTDTPTKTTIRYGLSPTTLTKTITTNSYTFLHKIVLNGLKTNTTYYFEISAINESGIAVSSEIFKIHTAKPSVIPNVENDIIVLSSEGNILNSDSQEENDLKNPSIILTNNSGYTIAYTLTNPMLLKSINVVVINKVLGANTFTTSDEPSEFIFPMAQKTPTLYVADLQTLPQGVYDVDIRLIDNNGNIVEKQISALKIMPTLIVYGADTHTPLSDARIYISYYDEQTKSYQPVTSTLFGPIKNPSYTDTFGQSSITLPAGNYRIEESSLFYDPATQDFTIGPGINQNFPVMYLKRDPFNLISLFSYTKDYFGDSWIRMLGIIVEASSSVRIFHLVALEILGTFVFLTFFFFLFRSHLRLRHLPIFILFHLNFLFKKHAQRYVFGSIIDTQNNPISRVRIEIENTATKNIISHGSSHKSGKFYFTNIYEQPINILFIKEGYEPTTITIDAQTSIPQAGFQIKMETGTAHHETLFSSFMLGLEEGFGMLFETFLVSSLLLEILFFIFLSYQKTLPLFLTLSFLNIILWVFYLRERAK